MIRAGQVYKDKENKEYLVFGLAEQEVTGACLVIFKNKDTRKFHVKSIDNFENEFVLSI